MTYKVQVDADGRICLPEELKESLGLHVGAELEAEERDGVLVMMPAGEPEPSRLYEKNGVLVYGAGLPTMSHEEMERLTRKLRERHVDDENEAFARTA